jgi:hypothetical protein
MMMFDDGDEKETFKSSARTDRISANQSAVNAIRLNHDIGTLVRHVCCLGFGGNGNRKRSAHGKYVID